MLSENTGSTGSVIGIISIILTFLVILNLSTVVVSAEEQVSSTLPEIKGETAVLMEGDSGEILYGKDEHKRMNPASTTKILTSLLLIENASLREQVTVSENAYRTTGSTMFLNINEKISVHDLLYGLLINSANDGAVAIAEHLDGSVESFAQRMNEKAEALGATNSNFENPHGLTEEGHKTTAYDLAVIAREAIQNPKLRNVMSTRMTNLDWPENDHDRELINRNELLRDYPGAFGVKTGYTAAANQTFVAAAERDGMTLIAVVLSSSRDRIFQDAEDLLDYGFANYEQAEILESGEVIATAEIPNARENKLDLVVQESLQFPLSKDATKIEQQVELAETPLKAPMEAGEKAGELILSKLGEQLVTMPIYTDTELVERRNYLPWILLALLLLGLSFLIFKRYQAIVSRKKTQERIKTRYRIK